MRGDTIVLEDGSIWSGEGTTGPEEDTRWQENGSRGSWEAIRKLRSGLYSRLRGPKR